ncbi:neuropeptide receptor 15 [Biomphalaria glabrata]|nr:neuropeptide receptor 15 [Biomphalaria glabrata]
MLIELMTSESPLLVVQIVATYDKVVSDYLYNQFETFVAFWLISILCCLGLVTNSFSMAVFMAQGFRDGVNISMMSIAMWDFIKCFTAVVNRLHGPISLISASAATSWRNMSFPVTAYTPIFSGYVTFCLTTYVSVERCLCVSRPFTFKAIFSRNFTLVAMVVISGVVFGAYVVVYFIYDIAYTFSPDFNTTIAVYRYNAFFYQSQNIVMPYYRFTGITIPFASFVVLCISSSCTVYYLRKSSQFLTAKNGNDAGVKDNSTVNMSFSRREKQVVAMLLSVIFTTIGNLFPRIIFYVAQLVEPELFLLRKYHNVFSVVAVCLFALDILRASVNFFLFLSMSTQFKQTFFRKYAANSYNYPKE